MTRTQRAQELVVALSREGLSVRQIGRLAAMDVGLVSYYRKRAGIEAEKRLTDAQLIARLPTQLRADLEAYRAEMSSFRLTRFGRTNYDAILQTRLVPRLAKRLKREAHGHENG